MCPLVAAPNRGYADWQRVENYDTGILYSNTYANTTAVISSPVMDCSRFAYTAGIIACTLNFHTVFLTWFADAGGTVPLGQRQFTLDARITNSWQFRIPNLGPFVNVVMEPMGANQYSGSAEVFMTNRYNPLESVPVGPSLLNDKAVAINNNVTLQRFPNSYYAGPVNIQLNALIGPFLFQIFTFDTAANDLQIDSFSYANLQGSTHLTAVVPAAAWHFEVTNESGNNTSYNLFVTPTVTGST